MVYLKLAQCYMTTVFIFKAFEGLESSHSEKARFSLFQRELVVFFGF